MRVLFALATCSVLLACGDSSPAAPAGPVVAAEITPADGVITGVATLTGQGVDSEGRPNTSAVVMWESLTPTIVTVDQMGTLTPVSTGIGTIRITVETFTAEATVRTIWNATSAGSLIPLFQFSTNTGGRRVFSDVSQADADGRTTHVDNVWAHLVSVLPLFGGINTDVFYTDWDEILTAAVGLCGEGGDPARVRWSLCRSPFHQHFGMTVAEQAPTTRFLAQQFMRFSYSEADAFPWLTEGWSSWIAGGQFDSEGNITLSGPRQVILDDFDAADSGGALATLFDLLHFSSTGFYGGTSAPAEQVVAQAAMFWGWLVTENLGVAVDVFQAIAANAGGTYTNDSLLSVMFGSLGLDVNEAEAAYLAWARAQ